MTATYSAAGPLVSPDAMLAAASLVQRDWGHYGYALAAAETNGLVSIFEVAHFDGSRFNVAADKWGNARGLSVDPTAARDEIEAMTRAAAGS